MSWLDDILGEDSYDTSTIFDGYSPGGDNGNIDTSGSFDFNGYSPDGNNTGLLTSSDFSGDGNGIGSLETGGGITDNSLGGLSGLGSLLSSSTLKNLLGAGLSIGQIAGTLQGNKGSDTQLAVQQVNATPMTWGGTGATPTKQVSPTADPFTTDWNNAFSGKMEGFAPGQTINWGGGKLTNNSGQFNYADPSGENFRFNQSTNPSTLLNNPNIKNYWENQYGADNVPEGDGKALLPLNKAEGGATGGAGRTQGALGLLRGSSPGQKDDVPINASHGEYVFDADAVAALGDGNTDAGAAKLDQMRENIRAHKRAAPSNKIPPKAKSPLAYLKGAK